MKMTIGTKLGAGFGTVIALLAISAGMAYHNISRIQTNIRNVLDDAVPTARSCDRLLGSLSQAAASIRGFLLVASDPQQADGYQADNVSAWKTVEEELAQLTSYASRQRNEGLRQEVNAITSTIVEQRRCQEEILQVAATDDNVPALRLFNQDMVPRVEQSLILLTNVIQEETRQETTAERMQLLLALTDLQQSSLRITTNISTYLSFGGETAKRAIEEATRNEEASFQATRRLADKLAAAQKEKWDRIVALREQLAPLSAKIVELRSARDWNRAEYLWATQSAVRAREIKSAVDQIAAEAEENRAAERRELDMASRATIVTLSVATVISIVIGSTVGVVLGRKIVGTVRALADRAKQISDGDLTGAAIATRSADELGQLADGFNVMLANLRDLTGQISSVTENVNSAAAQIASSAKQQVSSSKEQAATVQEITSTMQEISQSGSQIVAKAKEVAVAAEQASAVSRSGLEAVQSTNRTMEAIREQVEEVAENIVALSEKTQAVGEIISTVNEIAEQSNLLALNATIEAADAGKEGSRFSVVAAEMKNLADQAKECTVHVRKILGEIQKSINTSVMLTEEAVKRVESGKQQADVSEDVIRQMSSTTDESIQAFQQIIGATNQQQVGFEQVARGMQNIDQATQQTATGTVQLEQAVVSLSSLSRQLQTAVASYKV